VTDYAGIALIVTSVSGLLGTAVTCGLGIANFIQGRATHKLVDGQMTELKASVGEIANLEGQKQGTSDERIRREAIDEKNGN
jgi:hypothetical protein